MNLSEKILIFVGYCLPQTDRKFSYQKMADVFMKINPKKYSLKTLRKEFSCLKKAGLIKIGRRYQKPYPLLTRQGKLKIATRLSFKKFEHWDGKWRVAIFNIPESDKKFRVRFRGVLMELGFRKIQNGVYISPHPLLPTVNRIATELAIRQNMILLESENLENEKFAVQKIWHLHQINGNYKTFVVKARQALASAKSKPSFWPFLAKDLEMEFAQMYQQDPHLPDRLLPTDWQGHRAYEIFKKIVRSY